MAVTANAVPVGTSAGLLVRMPPGPCTVILSNASGHTVWIGTSSTVTLAIGVPVTSGSPPLAIPVEMGSVATNLWAIASSAVSLGVLVSTSH